MIHYTYRYGGGAQYKQPWPIEKEPRSEIPIVTADMLAFPNSAYGSVTEAYWISSEGVAIKASDDIPLFVSLPDVDSDLLADEFCLSTKFEKPFAEPLGSPLTLVYNLCSATDVREVHELTFPKFYAFPTAIPDTRMIQHPIWSTWAKFHTEVNDSRVIELALEIKAQGFNNSQIEIDDNWESCYGDQIFNLQRFPDPKGMVDQLHLEGFRVTLWIHPFINEDCNSFSFADQNGFLVKDANGQTQLTSWWQGIRAGILDFTNPSAAQWWSQRLVDLQSQTGLDSFKFDAGETNWLPRNYTLGIDESLWPNGYTSAYVATVSQFGDLIETRVGHTTQQHPIFVRMLDKDSRWGELNGLKTLVPSLLHSGILGYPFVLPDMIGGNAYMEYPNAELYTRWAQANTFMPSMQFSILPWDYDIQVTNAAKAVTSLHAQYTPLLIELAMNSTTQPRPMMRPTWWLCPTNEDCLTADQQFLVGDEILVTPVMEEAATTLEVVIPPGQWRRADTGGIYDGVNRFVLTDVTIDSNIYFLRQNVKCEL